MMPCPIITPKWPTCSEIFLFDVSEHKEKFHRGDEERTRPTVNNGNRPPYNLKRMRRLAMEIDYSKAMSTWKLQRESTDAYEMKQF